MNEDTVRFAVVVPTYEAEDHLAECLGSLRAVDEPEGGAEIVVVDGGSTDRTVEIAVEHGARVLQAPGTGVAEARNRAAEQVDAEVLVFVDADCRAPAELLAAAAEGLREHDLVGAFYEPTDEQGWIARTWLAIERKPAGEVGWVPAGTMAVRREAFAAVDGFREDLAASEDVDLCRRLRAAGYTVFHEPAMACEHLGQPDTLSAFFANEVGRSAGLVESVRRAEDWDTEHVTLAFALGHLAWPVALVAAAMASWVWLLAVLLVGLVPTLAWSVRVARRAGWRWWPGAVALLFVYNIARAVSLVKHRQFRDVRG